MDLRFCPKKYLNFEKQAKKRQILSLIFQFQNIKGIDLATDLKAFSLMKRSSRKRVGRVQNDSIKNVLIKSVFNKLK